MPTRHHTLLLCGLLLTLFSHAQQRTDQAEYGYKGPVKKVVTYSYDTRGFYPGADTVYNKNKWFMQTVYYFNRQGNFDSIHYKFQYAISGDTTLFSQLIYLTQGDDRLAIRAGKDRVVVDTARYTRTGDSSYSVIQTNIDGMSKVVATSQLTSRFRDKSGGYIMYEKDSIVAGDTYVNTLDADGRLIKGERTDIITGITTITIFRYANTDMYGNPHTVYQYEADGKKIRRISLREFEYY